MILRIQLLALLYAFIMGNMYGLTFSIKQYFSIYLPNKRVQFFVDFIYHMVFFAVLYYGLYTINGGINSIYLLLTFCVAIYLYYVVFYPTLLPVFAFLNRRLRPIYYSSYLLGSKVYSIMNMTFRRKKHGKHKEKKKKRI